MLLNKEKLTTVSYYGFGEARPDGLAAGTLGDFVRNSDEAVVITDTASDERVKKIFPESACAAGLATTIKHQGELHGVLLLGHANPRHFTEDDVQVLRSIAEQSALAIRNAQLYKQLETYAQGLESMVEARTQALQAAQQQLIRAEKLAALGTLAAGVAHEVNNPLQPILSSLEMALEDIDSKRPVERELLEYAMSDVQRIKRIVSNLLDFARPAQATPAAVDVNTIMNEVLALANKQLKVAGIRLNTTFGTVRKVRGSADQLKQVFLNLVVNAMDAMADMGRNGELNVTTREDGESVVVVVADNGIGIPADKLHQVFDPFFTTKPNGTGLGLSVSHSIIQGHGGEITVESNASAGSVFSIRLPASKDEPQPEPDGARSGANGDLKPATEKAPRSGKKS
jgi:signal transduction histidine kinase